LGVCSATAQALKNSGQFPYYQRGRLVLFNPDVIDEVMNDKKLKKLK
jgi:hypothetical protein